MPQFEAQGRVLLFDDETIAIFINAADARIVAIVMNNYAQTSTMDDIEALWEHVKGNTDSKISRINPSSVGGNG